MADGTFSWPWPQSQQINLEFLYSSLKRIVRHIDLREKRSAWEYQVLNVATDEDELEKVLKEQGREGWRLKHLEAEKGEALLILERRKNVG
jgi:hypothetical protein